MVTEKSKTPTMNHDGCPIIRTIEVVGGKWKPILLHFLRPGPRRTGEILRFVPTASAKVVNQQLRELERDGIVQRRVYGEVPPRVDYALTALGHSLEPVLDAMCAWGRTHPRG